MTIATIPNMPFTNNLSTADAVFLNHVRTSLPKCLDGVGGGTYNTASVLRIGGECIEMYANGGPGRLRYSSRSITRVQTGLLYNLNGSIGVISVPVAPTESAQQKLDRLPNGSTLTEVVVYHNRTDGGALPTNKAKATLWKRDITTGADTTIAGPVTDPTSPVGDYEDHHGFSLSGLSEVIDNEVNVYYVNFDGETGSNTENTQFSGCAATTTLTEQDESP